MLIRSIKIFLIGYGILFALNSQASTLKHIYNFTNISYYTFYEKDLTCKDPGEVYMPNLVGAAPPGKVISAPVRYEMGLSKTGYQLCGRIGFKKIDAPNGWVLSNQFKYPLLIGPALDKMVINPDNSELKVVRFINNSPTDGDITICFPDVNC